MIRLEMYIIALTDQEEAKAVYPGSGSLSRLLSRFSLASAFFYFSATFSISDARRET